MTDVSVEPHHLPTPWIPEVRLDDQTRGSMPLDVPAGSWWRALEDFARGFPALHIELAWVDEGHLHFATVAGFTFADEPDDVDEREILDRRRIPLTAIASVDLSLGDGASTVTLVTGEIVTDWPALLINQHL